MAKKIKFALAQMNPTVGDFDSNRRKILSWIKKAEKNKADLIVFPELAISGYPVWDLANKKSFVEEGLKVLEQIIKLSASLDIAIAVGYIDHPFWGRSKPLKDAEKKPPVSGGSYNAMAWIEKGKLKHKQYKRLLPTYDVFLEEIFFEPGETHTLIPWNSFKVAPTICEDIWDKAYTQKPLSIMKAKGGNLAINLSASPYYRGVADVRDELLKRQTTRHKIPMVYVNQVGAQDDLIFDGRSMFVDEKGHILFRAPAFKEDLYYVNYEKDAGKNTVQASADPISDTSGEMYEALVMGVRDYCAKNGFKKAILGLSGGIDSALVAALAVDALGADNVVGITMPGSYSSKGSYQDSLDLAKRFGMQCRVHPIKDKYEFLVKAYQQHKRDEGQKVETKKITLAMENLQARIRGMELMYLSNDEGRILLTTGNKSEMAMGYCTLYGDMAGGLAVLGDVYKTDVYRLCRYRNRDKEMIPNAILTKAPSAELRPDQKDSDSLPEYELLDEILYHYIEKNESRAEVCSRLKGRGMTAAEIGEVIRKVDHNEYKRRQTPPILRVTEKAWFGRRMPITNRFKK